MPIAAATSKKRKWIAIALAGVIGALLLVHWSIQSQAKDRVDAIIDEYDTYLDISYDDVSTPFLQTTPTISDVVLQDPNNADQQLHIDELILHGVAQNEDEDYPHALNLSINGVDFPLDTLPAKQQNTLNALGYERTVKGSLTLDYDLDKAQERLALNDLTIRLTDMFDASLSLVIAEGFNPEQLSESMLLFLFNPERIPLKLRSLHLQYTDASLLKRSIQHDADRQNMSTEELIRMMQKEIEAEQKRVQSPQAREIFSALHTFIETQGSFSLRFDAQDPLRLGTILSLLAQEQYERFFEQVQMQVSAS
ncbi:MAG: hypothetical protein ACQESV_09790 [Thermodesulfobacteriota bacterium]